MKTTYINPINAITLSIHPWWNRTVHVNPINAMRRG